MKKRLFLPSPTRLFFAFFCLLTVDSSAQSWVEVREEPRHHLVFENQFVRLLNVFIGPGDTTRYHRHNTPSVFIELSTTRVGSQLLGAAPVITNGIFSRTVTFDSINRQRIHRVWNLDTGWMHVIDAELPGPPPSRKIPVISAPGLEKIFAEEKTNGYQAKLQPGASLVLPANGSRYLVVCLGNGLLKLSTGNQVTRYVVGPGHYFWMEAGEKKKWLNEGPGSCELAVLQF